VRSTELPSGLPGRPASARRRTLIVLILLLAFTIIAAFAAGPLGCADGGNSAGDEAASMAFGPLTSGGLTITLQVSPYPPKPRAQSQFTVSVIDERGDQVAGAEVSIAMTMPAMRMPPNQPRALEQKAGQYSTPVVFTMAGAWEARVEVTTVQGETAQFTFAMKTR
jgi:hypothetical protein